MKPGDLVRWTFAKVSKTYNRNNKFYMGILLKEELPTGSWQVLLESGKIVHADKTEIDLVRESESR